MASKLHRLPDAVDPQYKPAAPSPCRRAVRGRLAIAQLLRIVAYSISALKSIRRLRQRSMFGLTVLLLSISACASIPKGQYGVHEIEFIGMKKLEPEALKACLVTRERDRTKLRLGLSSPSCGDPPFDAASPTLDLWTLPWNDWPIFDPAIFEVERERIERWYAARGYFNAHVVSVKTFVGDKEVDPNECPGAGSDCELKLVVQLTEGKATYVSEVSLESSTQLPAALMNGMRKKLGLKRGSRFDESAYEGDKKGLESRLAAGSYARAKVSGKVIIDRERRVARVIYKLEPGPVCVFGKVTVEGLPKDIPKDLVLQTANIREGKTYDPDELDDAQRNVFALRVFSSVKIVPLGEGRVVDLKITLAQGRVVTWSAGVGLMSGALQRDISALPDSVPQWDVHLKGTYENRNFLGGLRRLRLEERPRLIFIESFPGIPKGGPRPGNLVSLLFEQPAMFERRTKLVFNTAWDVGPDPYRGFFRHDVTTKVGFERPFWRRRIIGAVNVAHDFYDAVNSETPADVSDYKLPYLEQNLMIDLRDNPQRPRLGVYLATNVQEAFRLGNYGSWNYVRVLPEIRGYVPVFWDIVLAARFAIGGIFITSHAPERKGTMMGGPGLDEASARLGPTTYRLRGGGAYSNRGFGAGELGAAQTGGTRRWEGSLELRIPLGGELGFVLFGDVGDVDGGSGLDDRLPARAAEFRWTNLNASSGFGLRYHSILGALRLDFGWRLPGLQYVGKKGGDTQDGRQKETAAPTMHFTIGEAF